MHVLFVCDEKRRGLVEAIANHFTFTHRLSSRISPPYGNYLEGINGVVFIGWQENVFGGSITHYRGFLHQAWSSNIPVAIVLDPTQPIKVGVEYSLKLFQPRTGTVREIEEIVRGFIYPS